MKLFDIEKIKITSILPYFVIVVIALIYALPQLQIRGIYVGADNAFHFNRAFEAMSRIKNLNFNNSQISLYGFNASGRIVNALYGPGLGYFFGLVLLLTKSWLKFQLVTNFILTIGTMGLSYWLFNKYSKQSFLSLVFAILLSLTSYWSIGYWYQSSGGMTWGMMLFPLVLDAGMQMCTNKNDPVKVFRLGVVMALILESHMLSFVFSVGVLSVFFVLGMIVNNNRLILFRRSLFAAIISLGLTLGYWADYISIMRTQSILNPFVNLNPGNLSSNLYQGLAFWLLILSIVLIIGLSCKLLVWQWLLFIVGFIFLLVASGPKFILDNWNNVGFLRTVQFPMRFTLPGLYLLSFFVVTMLARLVKELSLRRSSVLAIGVGMLLLASMTIKSAFLNYYGANQRFWQDTNYVISKFSVAKNNQTLMPQMIIQSKNKNFEKSID
ncbi:cytochrome B, partial [uncultured Leuconostoc sp.]|uniref:cytochrome B n=1 Tax=uncultured Leuconostoc sp. TaxID=173262 RepID=UPI0025D76811